MSNTIYIYGDIGESWWDDSGITDASVRQELDALPRADSLDVRINTMGGETHHGIAIYNLLRSYASKQKALNSVFSINTIVDGFAYSAGSIIMLAGDKRTMNLGSRAMVHNPWAHASGDYRDLEKAAAYLKLSKDSLQSMYADVTGKDAKTFTQLLDDETYFTPEEAIALNLATEQGNATAVDKSHKNPYESNSKLFQELSKLGKGAYAKTMLIGKKVSEKAKVYPIEWLTKQLALDTISI